MRPTDILFEHLDKMQRTELSTDSDYQAAAAAAKEAELALAASLSPQQRQLLYTYLEQLNYKDSLELKRFFSHCSLMFLPQPE